MTEQKKNEDVKPPKKARTGVPKSSGITLKDAAGSVLRFTAVANKDGSAKTFAVYRQVDEAGKTKQVTRGATAVHANLDAARAALEKLVAQATTAGWQKRASSAIGRTKADAFDMAHLPKAVKK